MGVLEDHQGRIGEMREGLDRLVQLHKRAHDLNLECVKIAKSSDPGKEQKILALREQLQTLGTEIATLRKTLEPLAPKGEDAP